LTYAHDFPIIIIAGRETDRVTTKGRRYMEEEMTVVEMQRFLDEEARNGTPELEAYQKLMRILGVHFYPATEDKEKGSPQPTKA